MGTHKQHPDPSHRNVGEFAERKYPPADAKKFGLTNDEVNKNTFSEIPDCSTEMTAISEEADKLERLFHNTAFNFCAVLKKLAEYRNCSAERLAVRAELSKRRMDDFWEGQVDHPPLETVLALCIALNLPPVASLHLIRSANHTLGTSKLHQLYAYLIWCHHGENLHSWNQKLREAGFTRQLPYGRRS